MSCVVFDCLTFGSVFGVDFDPMIEDDSLVIFVVFGIFLDVVVIDSTVYCEDVVISFGGILDLCPPIYFDWGAVVSIVFVASAPDVLSGV